METIHPLHTTAYVRKSNEILASELVKCAAEILSDPREHSKDRLMSLVRLGAVLDWYTHNLLDYLVEDDVEQRATYLKDMEEAAHRGCRYIKDQCSQEEEF